MTPTQAIKLVDAAIDASFASREGTSEERAARRTQLREFKAALQEAKQLQRIGVLLGQFARQFNDPKLNQIISRYGH